MALPHPFLVALAAGREPGPVPDDAALLASAVEHGMQGLLWSRVEDAATEWPHRGALLYSDLATRGWHQRLWTTLATAQARIAGLDADVATIKGVTTEARWYARAGERPCGDVDLWLAPDAHERAGDVVAALEVGHPLHAEIGELVRNGAMQSVNVTVDGVSVDLHFDLLKLGIPTRQAERVWARTQHYPLDDGTTVRVLDAETALVNLLLHLNKDSFARLLGFADVARVLAAQPLDWDWIDTFVRGEGLEVPAYRSLATVVDRLGLDPPPAPRPRGSRARAWDAVWPDAAPLRGATGIVRSRRQDLIPVLARGRWSDTWRWWWRAVLPPRRAVEVRYADLPGPYAWRLLRGRLRTSRERRAAFEKARSYDAPRD